MSKMKSFQVIPLTLSMLMIISMVKGRWLDLETYSTSMLYAPHLRLEISNSSTLHAEHRCKSLYGFFPCADTMPGSVFLMFMYMYFMILGDEWTRTGSKVLFQWIGDKAFGESVFGVLKALPRIALFVVPGILSSVSDAKNQVVFGVSMYAGSTVITLTLVWGIRIILSHKLEKGSSQQDSSKKCLSLNNKLSFLTDKGVNIDKGTRERAVNLLCSLIPFVFVGLLHFINTPATTLIELIVSVASLLLYFHYQVKNPWSRYRSLANLNQEKLKTRFFYHVIRLAEFEDLVDKDGEIDVTWFERIFDEADKDKDKHISESKENGDDISKESKKSKDPKENELDVLVKKMLMIEDDNISKESKESKELKESKESKETKESNESKESKESKETKEYKEYAMTKAAILIHFDKDQNEMISREEFKQGCTNWLKEAISSGSEFKNIWNRVKEKVMMRKFLEQVFEKHGLLIPPDREKIQELFSRLPKNGDRVDLKEFIKWLFLQLARNGDHVDVKEFIKTLDFGKALDYDKVVSELVKDFEHENQLVGKKAFVDGFIKRIEKTIHPKKAIENFEEDWAAIHALLNPEKPKATIVYAIFGIAITVIITSPFIASVKQFSTAAHIPFLFTSFVMAPIAMKAKMVIDALLKFQHHVRKNASLKFSEIYDQLVMDNLISSVSLVLVVYIRGLSWTYSAEVLVIMIPCAIVGVFAIKHDTYPLWASILAILLYPVSVYIYYVLPNAS